MNVTKVTKQTNFIVQFSQNIQGTKENVSVSNFITRKKYLWHSKYHHTNEMHTPCSHILA